MKKSGTTVTYIFVIAIIVGSFLAYYSTTSASLTFTSNSITGDSTTTFPNAVAVENLNGVLYADQFSGADAGAKIAAAIAALPSTGGSVDASGLGGAQTIGSSLLLGSNTKPVTLYLGAGTYTLGSSAQIELFNGSKILGVSRSATTIVYSGSGTAIAANSPTSIDDVNYADLEGLDISCTNENSTTAISLQGVWYSTIRDVEISACALGIDVNGTNGGSYDNIIDNNLITGSATGVRFTGGGGQTGNSNMLSNNRIYGAVTGVLGVAGESQGNLIIRNDIEGAVPGTSDFIDYEGDVSTIEGNWLESTAGTSSDNFTGIKLGGTGNLVISNEYALVASGGGTVTNLASNGASSFQIMEPSLGEVGVNALPAAPLYVKATSNSYSGAIRIEGASSVNTWSIHPFGSNESLAFSRNSSAPYLSIQATNGDVGIGTTTPNAPLDVNGTSTILESSFTPPTSSSTCAMGMEAWDANYEYRCVATNTWKRAALSSF